MSLHFKSTVGIYCSETNYSYFVFSMFLFFSMFKSETSQPQLHCILFASLIQM